MWNKPHLLSAIADLLILVAAAALLAAGAVWLVRVPSLPVRQVVFAEALQHTRRIEVEQILPSALKGNFFSLNLEMVRGTLEKLPWVRKVEVRRIWPARLEVKVEEHRPAARWGEGRGELVNSYGEVFVATLVEEESAALTLLYVQNGERKAGAGDFVTTSGLAVEAGARHVGGLGARAAKVAGGCASAAFYRSVSGACRQTCAATGCGGFAVSEWLRDSCRGRSEGEVTL